jgi:hypothetical protein
MTEYEIQVSVKSFEPNRRRIQNSALKQCYNKLRALHTC